MEEIRVLVTGGSGYIGSVLVGYLLKNGYRVTVVDNLLHRQMSLFHFCTHDAFDFVFGDARDESLMKQLLKEHDIILPLAAIVGMKACDSDPSMTRSVNFEAIAMLNRLRSPQQRVIYPCTNSGYGTKTGDIHCTEDSPLEPITLYGTTKVAAEKLLLESTNTISLRIATVFGPSARMRLDLLVNDFVYRAFKDKYLVIFEKDFKRNYVHIEDVAECFCFCIEHFEEMKGEAYNLGLEEANLSKAQLASLIQKHVPSLYIHYAEVGKDPDKRNYIVSNDKLKNKGFVAKRSLQAGITQLLKTYAALPRDSLHNS